MDLQSRRNALQANQEALVGQINHIRGQITILDELLQEILALPQTGMTPPAPDVLHEVTYDEEGAVLDI